MAWQGVLYMFFWKKISAEEKEKIIEKEKKAVIDNDLYGGFIISENVLYNHVPIRYTFRQESTIPELNGWYIYSAIDDDEYVNNPDNFCIVSAETMFSIAPVFAEIFDAPYGTDLCWMYEELDGDPVLVGFYDLIGQREVSIDEIVGE